MGRAHMMDACTRCRHHWRSHRNWKDENNRSSCKLKTCDCPEYHDPYDILLRIPFFVAAISVMENERGLLDVLLTEDEAASIRSALGQP